MSGNLAALLGGGIITEAGRVFLEAAGLAGVHGTAGSATVSTIAAVDQRIGGNAE
jgi:hypothetical protein